jgi:hypothetical protein
MRTVNWKELEDLVSGLDDASLLGAISDLLETIEHFDKEDRKEGFKKDRAGYYRDVLSVYRKEQKKRRLS